MKKVHIILFCFLILSTFGVMGEFAGGSGIEGDPYLVETPEHLNNVRNHLDAHFLQVAEIDLSDYNDGDGWEPIGDKSGTPFSGVYDGSKYSISNLQIDKTGYAGLFEDIYEAQIVNVALQNVDISGSVEAGGIAARSENSEISSSYVTGLISSAGDRIGGIAGKSLNSVISTSYSDVEISGREEVGGLVGANFGDSTISNSYSVGTVSGTRGVGGLVGVNDASIENCYATDGVEEDETHKEGRYVYRFPGGTTNTGMTFGGLVGINNGNIISSYYDYESTGMDDEGKGEPRSTAEMMQKDTFINWDFHNIWGINEGKTYPFLLSHLSTVADLDGEIQTVVAGMVNVIIPYSEAQKKLGATADDMLELHDDGDIVAKMEFVDAESQERPYDVFTAVALQPYTEEEALALQVKVHDSLTSETEDYLRKPLDNKEIFSARDYITPMEEENRIDAIILEKDENLYIEADATRWSIAFFYKQQDSLYDYVDGGPVKGILSGEKYVEIGSYGTEYHILENVSDAIEAAKELEPEIVDDIQPWPILEVKNIMPVDDIEVAFATDYGEIPFPTAVEVELQNLETDEVTQKYLDVAWQTGEEADPEYEPLIPDTYTFEGYLVGLPRDSMVNTLELSAEVDVIVDISNIRNVTLGRDYLTIQEAIDDAEEDNTIEVGAGIYEEDLTIDIEGLKIKGANEGVAGYETRGEEATIEGRISIEASNIVLDGFDIAPPPAVLETGHDAEAVIIHSGANDVTVKNNIVRDFSEDGIGQNVGIDGIVVFGGQEDTPIENVEIIHNLVKNLEGRDEKGGAAGISIQGNVDGATVEYNEVHDVGMERTAWAFGIVIRDTVGLSPRNVDISKNTVHTIISDPETDTFGVGIGAEAKHAENPDYSITENTIDNCEYGLEVKHLAEEIVFKDNSLENISEFGVINIDEEQLDATENWWGHETGPYHDDSHLEGDGVRVSDNVDFSPWWGEKEMETLIYLAEASFIADPEEGKAPLKVDFTDDSEGTIDSWHWDFGDGDTSTEENPVYTYVRDDTYTVTLTVSGLGGEDTAEKEIVVDPGDIYNVGEDKYYLTIQDAIDDAGSGDTIEVAAGEYIEEGQFVIDKDLTIEGEEQDTIIKLAEDIFADPWFRVEEGVEFNLSQVVLDGDGKEVSPAIRIEGTGTIQNNTIQNIISGAGGDGIYVYGENADVAILDNTIMNCNAYGVQITDDSQATISNNVIDNNGQAGISVDLGAMAYIHDNEITGNRCEEWEDTPGIWIFDSSAEITDNVIADNDYGIMVDFTYGDLIISDNAITDNNWGVLNYSDKLVDATKNWWGTAVESEIEALLFGDPEGIEYSPWWGEEGMDTLVYLAEASFTAAPTQGKAPLDVTFTDESDGTIDSWQWDFGDGNTSTEENPDHTYVRDDTYTVTLTVSGLGGEDTAEKEIVVDPGDIYNVEQNRYYLTIQEAIDDASEGHTIEVGAGIYEEDLTVNKEDVTLISTESHEAKIVGRVFIASENVIFQDFHVSPPSETLEAPEKGSAIFTNKSGVIITGNKISDFTVDPGENVDNSIKVIHVYRSAGEELTISDVEVTDNVIEDITFGGQQGDWGVDFGNLYGIYVQGNIVGATVEGNEIEGLHSAGYLMGISAGHTGDAAPDNVPDNVKVNNNTLKDLTTGDAGAPVPAVGFEIASSEGDPDGVTEVEGNTFENIGIYVSDRSDTITQARLDEIKDENTFIPEAAVIDFAIVPYVPVTDVIILEDDQTILEGDTIQLTAEIEPFDATYQAVSWSSDDDSVATVDDEGKVTGVGDGVTQITVTMVEYPDISDDVEIGVIGEDIDGAVEELTLSEPEDYTVKARTKYSEDLEDLDESWLMDVWLESSETIPADSKINIYFTEEQQYGETITLTESLNEIWLTHLFGKADGTGEEHSRKSLASRSGMTIDIYLDIWLPDVNDEIETDLSATVKTIRDDYEYDLADDSISLTLYDALYESVNMVLEPEGANIVDAEGAGTGFSVDTEYLEQLKHVPDGLYSDVWLEIAYDSEDFKVASDEEIFAVTIKFDGSISENLPEDMPMSLDDLNEAFLTTAGKLMQDRGGDEVLVEVDVTLLQDVLEENVMSTDLDLTMFAVAVDETGSPQHRDVGCIVSKIDDVTFNLSIGKIYNTDLDELYPTIQDALDDAEEDNTIEVAAGTYEENLIIETDGIKLTTDENNPATIRYEEEDTTHSTVDIQGEDVVLENFNIERNEGVSGSQAINVRRPGVTVQGTTITGSDNEHGPAMIPGIHLTTGDPGSYEIPLEEVVLKDNHISGDFCYGIAVTTYTDASIEASIEDNTFTDLNYTSNGEVLPGWGVMIADTEHVSFGGSIYLTITGNTFDDVHGVYVFPEDEDTEVFDIVARKNSFSGMGNWGVYNLSGFEVDAIENWWGHGTGPHHIDINPDAWGVRVSDNVLFSPWWGEKEMETLIYLAPQASFTADPAQGEAPLEVTFNDTSEGNIDSWHWDFGDGNTSSAEDPDHTYVTDGTYTVTLTVSGLGGEDTAEKQIVVDPGDIYNVERNRYYLTIQDAIDDASEGDTIEVGAGTYEERVNIDKGISLHGPNVGVSAVNESREAEAIIDAGAAGEDIAIYIGDPDLGNITIDGFEIANSWSTAGIVQGVGSPEGTTVHVLNNIVDAPQEAGAHGNSIQVTGDNSTVIGNQVCGAHLPSDDWSGSGILVYGIDVQVKNNFVDNGDAGIHISGHSEADRPIAQNVVVQDNFVQDSYRGIVLWSEVYDTEISGNTLIGNDRGIEIYARHGHTPLNTIAYNNNIEGSHEYGAWVRVHPDDGTELPEGFMLDVTHNWWGDASGPYHEVKNPYGDGDPVSDNVLFVPWYEEEEMENLVYTVDSLDGEIQTPVAGMVNVIIPFSEAADKLGADEESTLELIQDGEFVAFMEYVDDHEEMEEVFVVFALQDFTEDEALALIVREAAETTVDNAADLKDALADEDIRIIRLDDEELEIEGDNEDYIGQGVNNSWVYGDLTVSGDNNTLADFTLVGDLDVTGDDNIFDTVHVVSSSPGGNLFVSGINNIFINCYFEGNVSNDLDGNVDFNDCTIDGNAYVGDETVANFIDTSIGGNLDSDGETNLKGDTKVDGDETGNIYKIYNAVKDQYYLTIQEAVTDADLGDTIQVAAGEYIEEEQFVIDRDLTIEGADKENTIIRPAQDTGGSGDDRGWFLVPDYDTEFNLSNVTLDGEGKDMHQAIRSYGTGAIDNNIIKNMRYSDSVGFGIAVFGNMVISNNTIYEIQRVGISIFDMSLFGGDDPKADNVVVEGNTLIGRGPDADMLGYGIEVDCGAKATISDNIFKNWGPDITDWASAGVAVHDAFTVGVSAEATITGNTFEDNQYGIYVGYGEEDESVVTAENNTFEGNDVHVRSLPTTIVDLDAILANNDFPADMAAIVGDNIQDVEEVTNADELELALSNEEIDTILLAAGETFVDDFTVQYSQTLVAEEEHEATIKGSVRIENDAVVVEGLRVENQHSNLSRNRGIYIDSATADVEVRNNIIDAEGTDSEGMFVSGDNTQIVDNTFKNIEEDGNNGFWTEPSGDLHFEGNEIDGRSSVNFNSGDVGAFTITFEDNTFKPNTRHGISIGSNEAFDDYTFDITGNTFEDTGDTSISDRHTDDTTRDAYWRNEIVENNVVPENHVWYSDGEVPPRWLLAPQPDVYNSTQNTPHDTIQAAVDDAEEGDTIEVAAGTYDETPSLDKPLTLRSVEKHEAVVDSFGRLGADASGSTIDGFTLTNGDSDGIYLNDSDGVDNVTIINNHFSNITGGNEAISTDGGVLSEGADYSGLHIEGNTIEDIKGTVAAIFLQTVSNSTVKDNYIDGGYDSETAEYNSRGIQIDEGQDVEITGNDVKNVGARAVQVAGDSDDITITGNTLTGSGWDQNTAALRVREGSSAPTVTDNTFNDNHTHVIDLAKELDLYDVLAYNDFPPEAAVVGNTIQDILENNVYNLDTGYIGTDIQGAIDAADPEDTIEVAAGEYDEDVSIDVEGLTLKGPNAGIHGDSEERYDEATVNRFSLSEGSDGTTIDGFRFTGEGSDAINSNMEELEDITVANNRFVDLEDRRAVSTFTDGSFEFIVEDNLIEGLTSNNAGIFLQDPDGAVIRNNVVRGGADEAPGDDTRGIQVDNAIDTVIEDNTVENVDSNGIQVAGTEGSEIQVRVIGNTVSKAGFEASRGAMVLFDNDEETVEVTDNTFRESYRGVQFFTTGNDQTVTDNQIKDNEFGVFVWDGDRSVTNNNIVGNDYGAWVDGDGSIDATENWWGHQTGPHHPEDNEDGLGDEVSDNVDFSDYLESTDIYNEDLDEYYLTIQAAVDDAEEGDTIELGEKTFDLSERLEINSSLTLKSSLEHGATIKLEEAEGEASSEKIIDIHADDVTIEDLVIKRTRAEGNGVAQAIKVIGQGITINNNKLEGNWGEPAEPGIAYGISVQAGDSDYTDDVTITNNEITDFIVGIGVISMTGTWDNHGEIGEVTVTDNDILDYREEGLQIGEMGYVNDTVYEGSVDEVVVTGNVFDSPDSPVMPLHHIAEYTHVDNDFVILDWDNIVNDNTFEQDVGVDTFGHGDDGHNKSVITAPWI